MDIELEDNKQFISITPRTVLPKRYTKLDMLTYVSTCIFDRTGGANPFVYELPFLNQVLRRGAK